MQETSVTGYMKTGRPMLLPRRLSASQTKRSELSPALSHEQLVEQLLTDDASLKQELARRFLREYVEQAWHVLEPVERFISGWHIDCICEHLEAVTAGEIKRLIINIPPRNMKSLLVSVMWPSWEWGPRGLSHFRYLFSSYSGELATMHSMNRRALMESDWYRTYWGAEVKITSDNNRKTEFGNSARGIMSTTSTGSTATGKGGNRIIVDDPINPKQALSDTERDAANRHLGQTLYSRLDDKKRDAFVLVMQRVHAQDPTGYLRETRREMGWTVLELPAEAQKSTVVVFPRSKREVIREVGGVLWPEKEPASVLAEAKVALGSYAYSGQYQQRPSPQEGGHIKRGWWRRYESAPSPPYDALVISSDLAFKDADTGSQVANHVWAAKGVHRYLLGRVTRHMGFTESISAILSLRQFWHTSQRPVTAVLVEDKANGPAVIETLRDRILGLLPIEPRGSKFARAMACAPQIEAGNVWLPSDPWADEVIDAFAEIPTGDNWDDVDAASQALDHLARNAPVMPTVAPFSMTAKSSWRV